jgi:hypothetical protein
MILSLAILHVRHQYDNTRILLALCHPRLGDVIPVPPPPLPPADKNVMRSEPLRQPIGRQDGASVPPRQPIGMQDGGGGERQISLCRM